MKYVIFDIDGVIFSEARCFDASAVVLWEFFNDSKGFKIENSPLKMPLTLAEVKTLRKDYWLDDKLMAWLKQKGINSNVDMIYSYILGTWGWLIDEQELSLQEPLKGEILQKLGKGCTKVPTPKEVWEWLQANTPVDSKKEEYFAALLKAVAGKAAVSLETLAINGEFYSGLDTRYGELYEELAGIYNGEETIVPVADLKELFQDLKDRGFTLCIGTGRPLRDVQIPLQTLGLWNYFDKDHVATYDDALMASILTKAGALDKPNPFIFRAAWWGVYPERYEQYVRKPSLYAESKKDDVVFVIGDSVADVQAAKVMGIPVLATLTGLTGPLAEEELKAAGATAIIKNVLDLKWHI